MQRALQFLLLTFASILQATPSAGPIVAVIDSGVNPTILQFRANLLHGLNLVSDDEAMMDYDDHGTPVISIITTIAPAARILPIAIAQHGSASPKKMLEAIVYAIQRGASIVNISMGIDDNILENAKSAVGEQQFFATLLVVASGNYPEPFHELKKSWPNLLVVSALALSSLKLASYSAYGENIDIAAPAGDINEGLCAFRSSGTMGTFNGTSAATPVISGLAAVAKQQNPRADVAFLKQAIFSLSHKSEEISVKYRRAIMLHSLPQSLLTCR